MSVLFGLAYLSVSDTNMNICETDWENLWKQLMTDDFHMLSMIVYEATYNLYESSLNLFHPLL